MSLYKSCKTDVSVDGQLSSSFSVKDSVHQGSAVQLLFGKKSGVLKVDLCGVCGEWVGSNSI